MEVRPMDKLLSHPDAPLWYILFWSAILFIV